MGHVLALLCYLGNFVISTYYKRANIHSHRGGLYWYKYCLRIYNRFKFIEPDIEWRNSDVDDSDMSTTDPSGRRTRTDAKSFDR
jgi:hypothetical protein